MSAAIDLHCARAGLRPPLVPEVERRLVVFEAAPVGPSYVAALEELVEAWVAAGELGGAGEALDRLDWAIEQDAETSHLGRGSALLMRAWLHAAAAQPRDTIVATARQALIEFRQSGAPWWIARALEALARHGNATGEVAAIRARLGVVTATS